MASGAVRDSFAESVVAWAAVRWQEPGDIEVVQRIGVARLVSSSAEN